MWQYIVRRLLLMIPTFFGITFICFIVLRMANVDPVASQMEMGLQSGQVSQEAIEHLRKIYHLDRPWYEQYGRLVWRLVTLDLGTSWRDGRPIVEIIGEALPITLLLSFLSLLIAYAIAIPLGVYSAVRQYSLGDQISTVVVFMLYSLPSFWVGTMLLIFMAGGHYLEWFPLQGWHSFEGFEAMSFGEKVGDVAWHIVLPLATLTYNAFAALSRYMRTGMLEVIRQDYIRTARAKGLSEKSVVFKHALRNSVIPIITLLGLLLPFMISGSVVVEFIFGIRGMGGVALEAIRLPDYPLVITIVAFTSVLTMLGILLSDILYAVVDPRISYGKGR
jgi:peptide/nickel transport system permease protein